MAEITFSRLNAFQLSQTKNPIPAPPESISPATITNQATLILNRKPVIMCGKLYGIKILVKYLILEKPNALATFLWSCGMDATPKDVLMSVDHKEVMKTINIVARPVSLKTTKPIGNQAKGETGFSNCTIG